ncbi:hypothetical protein AJ80_05464, partial [Polytolypa hystricis UAMH7299]
FTIWHLRTSYLAAIKDGVGDRLINVNSSVLNTPGFRAAGWSSTAGANAAHIKRTYSPPIPTGTAVAQGYFHLAAKNHNAGYWSDGGKGAGGAAGAGAGGGGVGLGFGIGDDDDEEGGMVTGVKDGTNTIAPRYHRRGVVKRSRRRERQGGGDHRSNRLGETEDDDSSDLSDESDEEVEGVQKAVQQIKFTKMPVRHRAGSSPIRSLDRREGPEVFVTSPSLRSDNNRFRRGSLGAVEAVKARARRDTATSSDMSSENEIDPAVLRSRQIHFSTKEEIITLRDQASSDRLDEEDEIDEEINDHDHDEDSIAESVGSAISSDFGATAGSGSLLGRVGLAGGLDSSSPLMMHKLPMVMEGHGTSPKKRSNSSTPSLNSLPPPRPISTVEPVSLLTAALKARRKAPANPIEKFGVLSGKTSTITPMFIKIYVPSSSEPDEPVEMPMVRESKESDTPGPVTVAEAIGLALWTYMKEDLEPTLEGENLNVNRWNLRMVEDGEVDFDFPPLGRDRPLKDFTYNNNRAATAPPRGRSRSRPYDEFALVEATPEEFEENEELYPIHSTPASADEAEPEQPASPNNQANATNKNATAAGGRVNPILGQPFSSALGSSLVPADQPAIPATYATPRIGITKTLKVRFIDLESSTQTTSMNISTDSYIAEILDSVCKKWGLDKGNHLLKVMNSNTVAPLDRTVEALGNITELDLVRRRFGGAGQISLTGSPGSSSPNAPLFVDNTTSGPKKTKKGAGGRMLHPLAQKQDVIGGYYRRYNVIRKQSMSFTASNQRVLAFDNDYMHIMPADTGKTLFESTTKTTSISFSDVVGSKVSRRHPKSFRVVVLKGNEANEQKRYDFEAKNALEAAEIVDEIKKNMLHYRV